MTILNDATFLLDRYEVFFLDIWGTLHGGGAIFPEGLAFLKEAKARSKKVFLVSNAPRRASQVAVEVHHKGLNSALYDGILTSGEDVFDFLSQPEGRYSSWGSTFFHIGRPELNIWEGTCFRSVPFLREASFILLTGLLPGRYALDAYRDLFLEARLMELPMICANPDQFVFSQGEKIWCAGKLASLYVHTEGPVYWHGKPIGLFFKKMMKLAEGIDLKSMLMIGDGMNTDVRGAGRVGMDSVFLASGMFGKELGVGRESALDAAALDAWLSSFEVRPTYVMASLKMRP